MKIKVILGKSGIEKKIKLPLYTVWEYPDSTLMSRFSIRNGSLYQDRIVIKFTDDLDVEQVTIGKNLYEKDGDAWDLSGWSEYSFDPKFLASKDDWRRMRLLVKIAFQETGE